jgi:hypothetical protein
LEAEKAKLEAEENSKARMEAEEQAELAVLANAQSPRLVHLFLHLIINSAEQLLSPTVIISAMVYLAVFPHHEFHCWHMVWRPFIPNPAKPS